MSYPPTNPGYPQTQQPGPYGAPGPSFAPAEAGPSKLPLYLTVAVVVLGLAAYLASFGPVFTVSAELGPFGGAELTGSGGGYPIIAATLAALLGRGEPAAQGQGLQRRRRGGVGARGASGHRPVGEQADRLLDRLGAVAGAGVHAAGSAAAVAVLLFESGVITPPAPRPRYDQFGGQYGPPPGGYYGQGPAQRPNYPSQQYGGYSSGPSTGGFGSAGPQNGPPTPPTGFPSFSPPPSAGSGQQQPEPGQPGQHSQAPSSSPPSGPSPS